MKFLITKILFYLKPYEEKHKPMRQEDPLQLPSAPIEFFPLFAETNGVKHQNIYIKFNILIQGPLRISFTEKGFILVMNLKA